MWPIVSTSISLGTRMNCLENFKEGSKIYQLKHLFFVKNNIHLLKSLMKHLNFHMILTRTNLFLAQGLNH